MQPLERVKMTELSSRAASLKALHIKGQTVVLPTVWDAWSARVAAAPGFSALSVSGAALCASLGQQDRESVALEDVLRRVAEITRAVEIPVSVDLDSGYGITPADLIDGLLDAGAVGLNVEDTVHSEGDRLRSPEEHAAYIGSLREAADRRGVPVVINARTDVLVRDGGANADRYDLVIDRLLLCAENGADCVLPVGVRDDKAIRLLADRMPVPINVIAQPAGGDLPHLRGLGVGRVTFAPFLQMDLAERAARVLSAWK